VTQDLSDDAHRIGLVEDGECFAPKPEGLRFGCQHLQPEAVERAHVELATRLCADQVDDAPAHLGSGLVREGDRQDRARRDPALDEARDAAGDHPRFSRASSGEYQQRPDIVLDRRLLGFVEGQTHDSHVTSAQASTTVSVQLNQALLLLQR
jgi:hypothetical protein